MIRRHWSLLLMYEVSSHYKRKSDKTKVAAYDKISRKTCNHSRELSAESEEFRSIVLVLSETLHRHFPQVQEKFDSVSNRGKLTLMGVWLEAFTHSYIRIDFSFSVFPDNSTLTCFYVRPQAQIIFSKEQ